MEFVSDVVEGVVISKNRVDVAEQDAVLGKIRVVANYVAEIEMSGQDHAR